MVARIWRGAVRSADADEYADYIRRTGIAAYLATPGNRGAWMLRRDLGDKTAGDDYERAVFYPEDDRYLIERDATSSHYEVEEGV
jgi:hypothetical protein